MRFPIIGDVTIDDGDDFGDDDSNDDDSDDDHRNDDDDSDNDDVDVGDDKRSFYDTTIENNIEKFRHGIHKRGAKSSLPFLLPFGQ
jgi:hypothetical protein